MPAEPKLTEVPARKSAWIAVLILILLIPVLSATLQDDPAVPLPPDQPVQPSRPDSIAAAIAVCQLIIRDTLDFAADADFTALRMRRDRYTGSFIGRGEVSIPNPLGGPTTRGFVCMVAPGVTARDNDSEGSREQAMFDAFLQQSLGARASLQ